MTITVIAVLFLCLDKWEVICLSKKLSVMRKKFADEYIICGNATQAAIEAGYSKRSAKQTGSRLLDQPEIKEYIAGRMKEFEEESIASQVEILQYLTRVIRDEETEEILVNVGNMEQEIRTVRVPAKDRIKAAELLGKRYQLWTDKVDLTSDLTLVFEDDYGDEDC